MSDSGTGKTNILPWYLSHGMLNAVFALWTFGGSIFLLFLGELGIRKDHIGIALSLFPFCQLIALGFAPIAARLGRKRVFLTFYGARKVVMSGLLLLPWIVTAYGRNTGIVYLFGIVAVFAVLRALAETAYYPWNQEFIPNRVRGKFGGWSAITGMIASIVALSIAGSVIGAVGGMDCYLMFIAIGCFLGLLGVLCMTRIPGGAPVREDDKQPGGLHVDNMRAALRNRNFLRYLGGFGFVTLGTGFLASFLPLFLKEQLGVATGNVIMLDTAIMSGGALASLGAGLLADRIGSRPVLMPCIVVAMLIPLGWLSMPRHAMPIAILGILYFLQGVAISGIAISTGRLLFNSVIPREQNTAYTAIYYAWLGLSSGLAPLMAGGILATVTDTRAYPVWLTTVDGYALLFAAAILCFALGLRMFDRVRPDDVHTTRTVMRDFANWAGLR